jgi:ATP-dependent DNA ligase
MYFKDNLVQTASRGGGSYNAATKHLREDPVIQALFKQNPDLILDGELYKHGADWPLQRISGLARQSEWKEECGELEYWIYDYIDTKQPFSERHKVLKEMKTLFPEDSKIKIVDHISLNTYLDVKKQHDDWVEQGFEGLCARNPEKEYGVNKRSSLYLIKLKAYSDEEFLITGVKEGLRPEDMCFTLVTKDGKPFAAKPMGTAEQRIYYLEHKDEFIGKKATCKYFTYSSDNVPTQPILVHIRPDDE